MSRSDLPSVLANTSDAEQRVYRAFSQDKLLRKAFRFISTDTYPIYRDGDQVTPPGRIIIFRSILWFFWVVSWPIRKVLQLVSRLSTGASPWHRVNELREHLNGLGFTQAAYDELAILAKSTNWRERHLASWNLALWHSDKYTKVDARKCLDFLVAVFQHETDAQKIAQALVLQAEAAKILGNPTEAAEELRKYTSTYGDNPNIHLALASLVQSKKDRLAYINEALQPSNITPVKLKTGKGHQYDLLTASVNKDRETPDNQPRVTVIIPAYNAADTIHTALESMIIQTWENLEIIVANDSSTDNTAQIVERFRKKDSRIKLITTPTNSGPYVARNLALQEATGEFITCNDSDDWSHPEKIERQAQHLIRNPSVIANASELARAYNDLSFYRRGLPGMYIQVNMSSLMFRRQPVIEKLGYWDSVRFGADSEFIKRLRLAFGDRSVVFMKNSLYSFLRQSDGSLTGSKKFGYHGFLMGARKEYADSQGYYHTVADSLRYSFPMKLNTRPFAVPYPMLPERVKHPQGRNIDVVIAADFRSHSEQLKETVKLVSQYLSEDKSIGIVQLYTYKKHAGLPLHESIRKMIDGEHVQSLVYGESIRCKQLIIFDAVSLTHQQTYLPEIQADQGLVIDHSEEMERVTEKYFHANTWKSLEQ